MAAASPAGVRNVEGAQELASIDGVTVLELDVAQPASVAAWADRVKAAADHVDVRALCAVVPDVAASKPQPTGQCRAFACLPAESGAAFCTCVCACRPSRSSLQPRMAD